MVKSRKLKYFGHITRRDNSLEKLVLEGKINGKRSRGRQKMVWMDNIKNWTGLKAAAAKDKAYNRDDWKHVVINALRACDI